MLMPYAVYFHWYIWKPSLRAAKNWRKKCYYCVKNSGDSVLHADVALCSMLSAEL